MLYLDQDLHLALKDNSKRIDCKTHRCKKIHIRPKEFCKAPIYLIQKELLVIHIKFEY